MQTEAQAYTQMQLDLKLAELRDSNRIWIVNNWIINVDGTFVPQVQKSMAAAGVPPSIPDFPVLQDLFVTNRDVDDVVRLIMTAPLGLATPSRRACSHIYCGRIGDDFAFGDIALHACGVRIASFTLEFVFRSVGDGCSCTAPRPAILRAETQLHLYTSAMLAENKTLRTKFDELVRANRVLCIREHPQQAPSRTLIINVDGVYVPEIRHAFASSGTTSVPILSLPTVEDVVDKGCETTVAAMIMAAPSSVASTRRARSGMLRGRNVQVMVDNGDRPLSSLGTLVSVRELLFKREQEEPTAAIAPAPPAVAQQPQQPVLPAPAHAVDNMSTNTTVDDGVRDVLALVSDIVTRIAHFRAGQK